MRFRLFEAFLEPIARRARMFACVVVIGVLFIPIAHAGAQSVPAIAFPTVASGQELLSVRDDFVSRLSPFDRSARLKANHPVSEAAYLAFVRRSALPWTEDERTLVTRAWDALVPRLAALDLPLPSTILFIKTSGQEEEGQEYTRGTSIVLPQAVLARDDPGGLSQTIAHELFHILSRNAPGIRSRLYSVIGFISCNEVPFPPELTARKITDPDAPRNHHYIHLTVQATGRQVDAIPILYSSSEHVASAQEFFQNVNLRFLLVHTRAGGARRVVSYDSRHPELLTIDQVSGFYEQVGRNTEYIIHPEEILADNFRLILLGFKNPKSPDVLANLEAALQDAERPR
jgi:hypothetical protein